MCREGNHQREGGQGSTILPPSLCPATDKQRDRVDSDDGEEVGWGGGGGGAVVADGPLGE